ncbi:MAG: ATP-binding domain-containing protein [Bacteroidetes bacterium]|nr:ATP-binding domain-containing protein [Bacteroidota bacterium]
MGIKIIRGISKKPVVAKTLVQCLSSLSVNGLLFIGHPTIPTTKGAYTIDALLICKEKGIVIIDLIEGESEQDYCSRQDDSANKLESLLRTNSELMKGRELLVPIQTISFGPAIPERLTTKLKNNAHLIANSEELLQERLDQFEGWRHDSYEKIYSKVLSVIQNVSFIRENTKRSNVQNPESRGAKLIRLEKSIATLDQQQNRAAIETVEGVQRIRGLAGSGKTIVLAMKAAYLHVQNPDWRIAVTFYTRSLKGHFRQLIRRFTSALRYEEPDWSKIELLHGWGSPRSDNKGIYSHFCMIHDVNYHDYHSAKNFGEGTEFSGACANALQSCREYKQIYDVILVDEAQDLPAEFLQICYQLLNDKKMLIYAFDDLQNLSDESLPSPEIIFGKDQSGDPVVSFDQSPGNDIILEKCYRNSGPLLTTAHALGFGIYRKVKSDVTSNLVQMFDHPDFWKDVGYRVKKGNLIHGNHIILHRTEDSSPRFLVDHSPIQDLIQFICFRDQREQTEWLINEIRENLEIDELRYEDIMVINPDPRTTRNNVGHARARLLEMGINNHLAGVDSFPEIFYKNRDSVTFTGVHRAKGNEAGMVYVINAHECHSGSSNRFSLTRARNQLFTAITRSKAWVRVLGYGDDMKKLKEEFEQLNSKGFDLEFDYPSLEEIEQLRLVHREVSSDEIQMIQEFDDDLSNVLHHIESGTIHLSDLDETVVYQLKEHLQVAD